MADRKVKVGIIGCGVIANLTHGPEYERLKDQVEVIAACDIDPPGAGVLLRAVPHPAALRHHRGDAGGPRTSRRWTCACTTTCTPRCPSRPCGGARTCTAKSPWRARTQTRWPCWRPRNNTAGKLHIQLAQLYSAGSYAAKELIDHGQLGHIYHMRSTGFRRRGRPYVDGYGKKEFVNAETSGGGALLDMGVYHISQLLYLTGNPVPQRFVGHAYQELEMDPVRKEIAGYNVEELITGMIDFDGGLTMDLIESWAMHLDTLECSSILGSLGGVRLDPFSYHYTQHDIVFNATIDEGDLNFRSETVHPERLFYRSSQGHWLGALQGKCPLLPTAEIALNTQLIQEGLYLSHDLQRQVTAEEVKAASVSKNTEVIGLY